MPTGMLAIPRANKMVNDFQRQLLLFQTVSESLIHKYQKCIPGKLGLHKNMNATSKRIPTEFCTE